MTIQKQIDLSQPDREAERAVYFIFTSTNSMMGRIIRIVTGSRFNHISLSLSDDFHEMYSFARYHRDAPLQGGFVVESPLRYYDYRFKTVWVKICRLPVSDSRYVGLVRTLAGLKRRPERYLYNTVSAVLAPFDKRRSVPGAYTCCEFAERVLDHLGAGGEREDGCCTIQSLEKRLNRYTVFQGDFARVVRFSGQGGDRYFEKVGIAGACLGTMRHFFCLALRLTRLGRSL